MIKYLILSSSCGKIGTLSFLRSAIVFEGKISDSKKKKKRKIKNLLGAMFSVNEINSDERTFHKR